MAMAMFTRLFLSSALLLFSLPAEARQHRSREAVEAFKRAVPCPVEGAGSCFKKGYVVDHVIPLCAGGADSPANMAYQRKDEAAAKDKLEWAECRALKKR